MATTTITWLLNVNGEIISRIGKSEILANIASTAIEAAVALGKTDGKNIITLNEDNSIRTIVRTWATVKDAQEWAAFMLEQGATTAEFSE